MGIKKYDSSTRESQAITASLADDPHIDLIDHIVNDVLGDFPVWYIGGGPRDRLRHQFFGHIDAASITNDHDFWIDDKHFEQFDLEHLFDNGYEIGKNRFGNVKLRVNGVSIDVARLSTCNLLRLDYSNVVSIETALQGTDLTTSSLAYNMTTRELYDAHTVDAITRRVVDVAFPEADEIHILMARFALHAERFGYGIGQKAAHMIREHYEPGLDPAIHGYLDYKEELDKHKDVIQRLREISRTKV